jgi:hypothetical protein|tara:strand:+ start:121 stop:444 length:324 start_codon:yes stop_codon:yes gene_type:complete
LPPPKRPCKSDLEYGSVGFEIIKFCNNFRMDLAIERGFASPFHRRTLHIAKSLKAVLKIENCGSPTMIGGQPPFFPDVKNGIFKFLMSSQISEVIGLNASPYLKSTS